MPSPSTVLATHRPELRSSFEEFDLMANRNRMIALSVLPTIDVVKASGIFGKIPLEQLLMKRDTLRAPGAGYSRQTWTFTSDTYTTEEHGAEEPVDDNESAMYSDFFVAEQIASQRAFQSVLVNFEVRVATAVFNTTTWTGAALTTDGSNWTDHSTGTPIDDIEAAMQKVWSGSGLWPNTLICPLLRYRDLIHSSQVIERVKYQNQMDVRPGQMTQQAVAAALGIDQILVAGSQQNTANPGQAAVLAPIWDSTMAMVCTVGMSQDPREPCVGKTFHFSADGSDVRGRVETYRDESVRSDIVRVRHQTGEKIQYPEAGHLLTGLTS